MQERTNTNKQSKVGFLLSRQKMSQLFPLDISGWVGGQKPIGRTWAHRTETEIRTKAHRLYFFPLSLSLFFSLLHRYSYQLHLGIPLIISSHASIGLCLSVVFNTTQDSSVCLSVSYSAPHDMVVCLWVWVILIVIIWYDSVCISVPTSPSHKMAVFASFSHAEHHTRW